tara:strand:- start:3737 stop:4219 length:483 start_codon:yes stop_codon:yes gene_type:complete
MNEEYEIVTDSSELSKPCKKVEVEEGEKIGRILLSELKKTSTGVGLAANQIGIDASVCVINVNRQVVLVNPVIKNSFKKIFFQEACLSFPGEAVVTQRYANIAVQADNHRGLLYFGENNLLECVCAQHEIDHLNGITMFERQIELDKLDDIEYIGNKKRF